MADNKAPTVTEEANGLLEKIRKIEEALPTFSPEDQKLAKADIAKLREMLNDDIERYKDLPLENTTQEIPEDKPASKAVPLAQIIAERDARLKGANPVEVATVKPVTKSADRVITDGKEEALPTEIPKFADFIREKLPGYPKETPVEKKFRDEMANVEPNYTPYNLDKTVETATANRKNTNKKDDKKKQTLKAAVLPLRKTMADKSKSEPKVEKYAKEVAPEEVDNTDYGIEFLPEEFAGNEFPTEPKTSAVETIPEMPESLSKPGTIKPIPLPKYSGEETIPAVSKAGIDIPKDTQAFLPDATLPAPVKVSTAASKPVSSEAAPTTGASLTMPEIPGTKTASVHDYSEDRAALERQRAGAVRELYSQFRGATAENRKRDMWQTIIGQLGKLAHGMYGKTGAPIGKYEFTPTYDRDAETKILESKFGKAGGELEHEYTSGIEAIKVKEAKDKALLAQKAKVEASKPENDPNSPYSIAMVAALSADNPWLKNIKVPLSAKAAQVAVSEHNKMMANTTRKDIAEMNIESKESIAEMAQKKNDERLQKKLDNQAVRDEKSRQFKDGLVKAATEKKIGVDVATRGAKVSDTYQKNKIVGEFQQGLEYANNIDALIEESRKSKTGVAAIAIIFQYMKDLDKNSVVRPSEYDAAAGAAGWAERILFTPEWIKTGKISEKTLEDIRSTVHLMGKALKHKLAATNMSIAETENIYSKMRGAKGPQYPLSFLLNPETGEPYGTTLDLEGYKKVAELYKAKPYVAKKKKGI